MFFFLRFAFLFLIGSVSGWVMELFYRRFLSDANPERKWINPGFCTGPYLPLYGSGLCLLYLIASLEKWSMIESAFWNRAVLFLLMAVCMTIVEYIAGIFCVKVLKVRLWDYTHEWGNVQGVICPKFSFYWAVLGGAYYFFIHPHLLQAINWLSQNLAFSFVIGMFYGVFIIDVVHSAHLIVKLKQIADEYQIIVKYENLKAHVRSIQDQNAQKHHFFFYFRSETPLAEHLKELASSWETRIRKQKKKK